MGVERKIELRYHVFNFSNFVFQGSYFCQWFTDWGARGGVNLVVSIVVNDLMVEVVIYVVLANHDSWILAMSGCASFASSTGRFLGIAPNLTTATSGACLVTL